MKINFIYIYIKKKKNWSLYKHKPFFHIDYTYLYYRFGRDERESVGVKRERNPGGGGRRTLAGGSIDKRSKRANAR